MKELSCELEKQSVGSTSNMWINSATKLWINFYTYEIHQGLIFEYKLLNEFDYVVDAGKTTLGGSDWQNWPPAANDNIGDLQDENYILDKICNNLLVVRKQSTI